MLGRLRLMGVLIFLTAIVVSAGCNTVEGFGKDVQNAGEALERKAQENGAE